MKMSRRVCFVAVMAIIWVSSAVVACCLKDAAAIQNAVVISLFAGFGYLLTYR